MITSINTNNYAAQDLSAMRQNRFKKADANGDGKITKDELQAVLPQNGKGPSVDDIFSKMDTNHDGAIDQSEAAAAAKHMQHHHGTGGPPDPSKMAAKLFKQADANGDGKITKDELTQALPKNRQGPSVDDIFKAADTDQDGSISMSELENSLKKMFEARQANITRLASQTDATTGYDRTGDSKDDTKQPLFSAVA